MLVDGESVGIAWLRGLIFHFHALCKMPLGTNLDSIDALQIKARDRGHAIARKPPMPKGICTELGGRMKKDGKAIGLLKKGFSIAVPASVLL